MALLDVFCTADQGKIIALPLPTKDGTQNNFTGATATLYVKDPTGIQTTHAMSWNPGATNKINGVNGPTIIQGQWEYQWLPGDLPTGRVGIWHAMVGVTFAGEPGPTYSSDFSFEVVDPD